MYHLHDSGFVTMSIMSYKKFVLIFLLNRSIYFINFIVLDCKYT